MGGDTKSCEEHTDLTRAEKMYREWMCVCVCYSRASPGEVYEEGVPTDEREDVKRYWLG
jgi:hypothetical protein